MIKVSAFLSSYLHLDQVHSSKSTICNRRALLFLRTAPGLEQILKIK